MNMDLNVQLNHDATLIESTFFLDKPEQPDQNAEKEKTEKKKSGGIRKDLRTIVFLMYMYFLQGIPLGLTAAIPLILSSRKVGFSAQGTFSFAFWPFSLKLLWAPIVDSLYMKRIGRRRSWIVPINLLIAIFMFAFGRLAKNLLYNSQSQQEILVLAIIFLMLTFLAATQDIVVDGWAISLLSVENVTWQSTCNGAGQTAGIYIGNICFIIFESASFCNNYIRPLFGLKSQDYGILDLEVFMYFFGAIFVCTAILISIFKNEKSGNHENDEKVESENVNKNTSSGKQMDNLPLLESYKVIWHLLSLKAVRELGVVLLTAQIGLATASATSLKLIEHGVPKEKLSLLAIPLGTISMIWPLFLSKFLIKHNPFMIYFKGLTLKVLYLSVSAILVYFTPSLKDASGSYSYLFFSLYFVYMIINSIFDSTVFISQIAFFAKVSDPMIGGTYMTLLTTLSNLGGMYPSTLALYLIGFFSAKVCLPKSDVKMATSPLVTRPPESDLTRSVNETLVRSIKENTCSTPSLAKQCAALGGFCVTKRDAYYALSGLVILIGVVWLIAFFKLIKRVSHRPKADWKLKMS